MLDGLEFLACIDGLFSLFCTTKTKDTEEERCERLHQSYWKYDGTDSDMTNNWTCSVCKRKWRK